MFCSTLPCFQFASLFQPQEQNETWSDSLGQPVCAWKSFFAHNSRVHRPSYMPPVPNDRYEQDRSFATCFIQIGVVSTELWPEYELRALGKVEKRQRSWERVQSNQGMYTAYCRWQQEWSSTDWMCWQGRECGRKSYGSVGVICTGSVNEYARRKYAQKGM